MGDFTSGLTTNDKFRNELATFITKYKRQPKVLSSSSMDDSNGDFYKYSDWLDNVGKEANQESLTEYNSYVESKLQGLVSMTAEDLAEGDVMSTLNAFFDLINSQFIKYGVSVKHLEVNPTDGP